jgi:hypothetical protein
MATVSQCSSGSIVSGCGLDDRAIEVRSLAEAKEFSSILCVQTGSEAHPASCTMGTGGPFPGDKARPGRDADHSPHLLWRSRMSRSYTPSPPRAFMDSFRFRLQPLHGPKCDRRKTRNTSLKLKNVCQPTSALDCHSRCCDHAGNWLGSS